MMLGLCITDENGIEVKILLVALQYPLDRRKPSFWFVSHRNRRKLWVWASDEAHVYASLMRVIIKTHYEFQNVRSHLPFYCVTEHTEEYFLCSTRRFSGGDRRWGASNISLLSIIECDEKKKKTFCFLAQFLLHDNIIASEPH